MKKLVTLMLALSLGGSQVFAAGSSAQEKSPAANLAIGGAIAATLLYLIAPQGENSFMAKLSTAFDAFVSGRATPAQCAAYVVNHVAGQATQAGTDLLNSVQSSVLTDAQRILAHQKAGADATSWINLGYFVEQDWITQRETELQACAAKIAIREEHLKVAPMFALFKQLFGLDKEGQQQTEVDQYLATGIDPQSQVQATVGN